MSFRQLSLPINYHYKFFQYILHYMFAVLVYKCIIGQKVRFEKSRMKSHKIQTIPIYSTR